MKLSLSMFELAFGDLVTLSSIRGRKPTITGIRVLEGDQVHSRDEFVYISIVDTEEGKGQVFVLLNRRDSLYVSGCTFDQLINLMLETFERYNSWEARFTQLCAHADSLPQTAELACDMLRRSIAISDLSGKNVAYAFHDAAHLDESNWGYLAQHGSLNPEIMSHELLPGSPRQHGAFADSPTLYEGWDYTDARGELKHVQNVIGCNVVVAGEHRGNFIFAQEDRRFTLVDYQHAAYLREMLSEHAYYRSHETLENSRSHLLAALIDGSDYSNVAMDAAQMQAPWPWLICAVKSVMRTDMTQQLVFIELANRTQGLLACMREEAVFVCGNSSDVEAFIECLEDNVAKGSFALGKSLPFSNVSSTPLFARQALYVLGIANDPGIYDMRDYAYRHLHELLAASSQINALVHPALETLEVYDAVHDTRLYETLCVYLLHERHAAQAAQALYLHRNTLLYRVRRICELTGLNLDEPAERQYLLLSYLATAANE
jgi:hypothetical protein